MKTKYKLVVKDAGSYAEDSLLKLYFYSFKTSLPSPM